MTLLCLFVLTLIHLVPLHLSSATLFAPWIWAPSCIPNASYTKQNYVMSYPRVHTKQLSGSCGRGRGVLVADIHRAAGGKADVKHCRSRLMGAGGEWESLIYSGGLPGWPLHCQKDLRRVDLAAGSHSLYLGRGEIYRAPVLSADGGIKRE